MKGRQALHHRHPTTTSSLPSSIPWFILSPSLPLCLPTIAIPSHSYLQRLKAIHRQCLSGRREGAFVSVRTRSMNNKHKIKKKECTPNTHATTKRTILINLEAINFHVYDCRIHTHTLPQPTIKLLTRDV